VLNAAKFAKIQWKRIRPVLSSTDTQPTLDNFFYRTCKSKGWSIHTGHSATYTTLIFVIW